MTDLANFVEALNGLTWPGAFALVGCALAAAWVATLLIGRML